MFFLIMVLAVVGLTGLYFRHEKEKALQAERDRQQELARAEAAKAEAARVEQEYQEAKKKHQEEIARKRAAAREEQLKRRQAEKARAEQEKKAAAEKAATAAQDARRAACDRVLAVLKGGTLRPWKTIGEDEQPDTAKGERTFHYVFPDDDGGRMFLELKTMFGRPVSLHRLDSVTSAERYEPTEFRQLAAVFPHLLVSGDKVYFRPSRADMAPCRVPEAGGSFDPAQQDFGDLYETVRALGLKTDAFVYGVYFRPFGSQTDVPVAKVAFGGTVPAETFREKVFAWARRNAAASAKGAAAARNWKQTYVFTEKDRVKKRVDGVTEVPRTFVFNGNKHRYLEGSLEYENEVKKEEAARRKWQALVDEVKRQEETAKRLAAKKGGGGDLLESGAVVYKLMEAQAAK
ncbi:MAG: hypothetical protein ACI4RA_02005 [Kiritimatiellia bacterium]